MILGVALAVGLAALVVAVALRLAIGRGGIGVVVAVAAVGIVVVLAVIMGGVDRGGGGSDPVTPEDGSGGGEVSHEPAPLRPPEVRLIATSPDALPPVPGALGDLAAGTVLVLRVSGLDAGSTATVHQCRAGALDPGGCRAGLAVNVGERGSATTLVDLESVFEAARGEGEIVDCEREACSIVAFGSSRLEVTTIFGRSAPPPARITVEPTALPPGSSLTATASGLEEGARAAFLVCRPGGEANADCGEPSPPVIVGADGRVTGEVVVSAGRCPRGGRCAVAVVVGDGGPRAFAGIELLGRSGATYEDARVATGLGIVALLLLVALWLLRSTDWTPADGDPFAGVVIPDDPFGPDAD